MSVTSYAERGSCSLAPYLCSRSRMTPLVQPKPSCTPYSPPPPWQPLTRTSYCGVKGYSVINQSWPKALEDNECDNIFGLWPTALEILNLVATQRYVISGGCRDSVYICNSRNYRTVSQKAGSRVLSVSCSLYISLLPLIWGILAINSRYFGYYLDRLPTTDYKNRLLD